MTATPTTASKIQVASQLPEAVNAVFATMSPGAMFISLPSLEAAELAAAAPVLMVGPGVEPLKLIKRPDGWPFGFQWVHLLSAGLDAYPAWLLDAPLVTNSPGLTGQALAEYCMAAILSQTKRLERLWVHSAEEWKPRTSAMVAGSKLGIVGFGTIGKSLARLALAFDMQVAVLRKSSAELPDGVRRAESLSEIFETCDHVVLAAPADQSTAHMVNKAVLARSKPELHLINVARGSLVDQEALLAALDEGKIGFATLDVTDPEPLPTGSRLYRHPLVRISAHTAGVTPDLLPRLADLFAANLDRFRRGEPMLHLVGRSVEQEGGTNGAYSAG